MERQPGGPSGGFPSTHWSQIRLVRDQEGGEKRLALDTVLVRYLPALRVHLLSKGIPSAQLDDLLNHFVADKILEKDLIAQADPQRGKFRTFLLTALDRFVSNHLRDAQTKQQRFEEKILALESCPEPAARGPTPAMAFEIAWARQVVQEALRRMKEVCENSRQKTLWEVFYQRIVLPTLAGGKPIDYRQLVERYDFSSPLQVSNTLITAKRMYTRILRSVVSEYAGGTDEVEAELADLRKILSQPRA